MRRFTDPILFLALFILSGVVWLILSATGGIGSADPEMLSPISVGTVLIIATPALFSAACLGLTRVLLALPPKRFYTWALVVSIVGAVVVALTNVVASSQGVQVGFLTMVWFFSVMALAFLIALIISFTGGIPDEDGAKSESLKMGRRKKDSAKANPKVGGDTESGHIPPGADGTANGGSASSGGPNEPKPATEPARITLSKNPAAGEKELPR